MTQKQEMATWLERGEQLRTGAFTEKGKVGWWEQGLGQLDCAGSSSDGGFKRLKGSGHSVFSSVLHAEDRLERPGQSKW